jgi:hypothetical protein
VATASERFQTVAWETGGFAVLDCITGAPAAVGATAIMLSEEEANALAEMLEATRRHAFAPIAAESGQVGHHSKGQDDERKEKTGIRGDP